MPVIGYHIILTGYGHWPPNDPRGSLSQELRKPELGAAAEMHFGRKAVQPSREELRAYRERIDPLLKYDLIWFDTAKRQALGAACGGLIEERGYTCYAAAIMSNHVHLLIRRHRDTAEEMIDAPWAVLGETVRAFPGVPAGHPVWAKDPYRKFKYTPEAMRECVAYIENNPREAGEPPQHWPFVTSYNNWPFHNKRR